MKRIIQRILKKLKNTLSVNEIIRNSRWYYDVFPHLKSFEKIKRNSDIICLGSTPARFDISFEGINGIVGSNLAVQPETIFYDFQVLKNYHSYLKKQGVVLFVLCPFTLLKDKYTPEDNNLNYLNTRYYPVLHRALIDNFDESIYETWVKKPSRLGLSTWINAMILYPLRLMLHKSKNDSCTDMHIHAEERVYKWQKEFKLSNLVWNECPINVKNNLEKNISIFKEMISFIKERDYNCVIVIPPFSKELTELLPNDFVESSLIHPLSSLNCPVFSYFGNEGWYNKDMFRDSFTMNENGSKRLTEDIIKRLQKINFL